MSAVPFKTRSEQRLEQLEALRRPLTSGESAELRRCLHAIYMRNWRLTQNLRGRVGGELADAHRAAKLEIEKIAERMDDAFDVEWPTQETWHAEARHASQALYQAIRRAGVRP